MAVVTIIAAVPILFTAGAVRFYHNLIPDPDRSFTSVDARTRLVITQLGTCALHVLCSFSHLTFGCDRLAADGDAHIPNTPCSKECAAW